MNSSQKAGCLRREVAVGILIAFTLSACSQSPVPKTQRIERDNVALLRRSGVLIDSDRILFKKTMSYRNGESDNAPIGGYLTRVEVVMAGTKGSPASVGLAFDVRARIGGFTKVLSDSNSALSTACYSGHAIQLCVLVARLEDSRASAELSVDTHPRN